jgi:hypothetical protein
LKNEESDARNAKARELSKLHAQVEAQEFLHKMQHINPELAQVLEQQFKDEGIL